MSMQVQFNEGYLEITTYSGSVNDKYDFVVDVGYLSKEYKKEECMPGENEDEENFIEKQKGKYFVETIKFLNSEPENVNKAKDRISKLVMKWHYGDPDHKDEND